MGNKGLKSIAIVIKANFCHSIFFLNALKVRKIEAMQVIHLKKVL